MTRTSLPVIKELVRVRNPSSLRVWLLLSALSIAFMIIGEKLADRHGLLIGFLLALIMNAVVFFYGDFRLLKRFHCGQLEGQDPWGLLTRLQALSKKAGITMPRLFVLQNSTPTILSLGMSSGQSAILISSAVMREFSLDEIEALFAFEVARLKRQDTLAATAASALTGVFSWLARFLDQVVFLQFLRPQKPCQLKPAMAFFSPLIALLTRIVINNKSFLASDALAAALIENPQRLAKVLWKLDSFHNTRPFDIAPSDSQLFMVSPLTSCFWYRYFQVQPTVEQRIKLLVGHYPI